jgi:signal transduction histidine kinase
MRSRLHWGSWALGITPLVTITMSSMYVLGVFPFWFALQMALALWAPYAVMAPAVLMLARRFPLNGSRWRSHAWIHVVGAVVFVAVCEGCFVGLISLLRPQAIAIVAEQRLRGKPSEPLKRLSGEHDPLDPAFPPADARLIAFKMQFSLPLYWALVGFAHALGAMLELRERERQAAQLTAHLARAQLAGLRTQLQPHFLFNTLNSIAALIPRNGRLATEMVMNLSDLLRMTLREPQRDHIPLHEELTLLRHYVDIQRLRFGERLSFDVQATREALAAHVPPLLLQPLVENAIRHGVEASDRPERVAVHGRIADGRLILEVLNTFCCEATEEVAPGVSTGVGLTNTRARLRVQYAENHEFQAGRTLDGGFRVHLAIPAENGTNAPSVATA